jgi:nucleoside-diphosphate-sugar epimerase
MRVYVAGATGAIGSRLVPALVRRGHEVIGTTRSSERARAIEAASAAPAVVDALDEVAVRRAVGEAVPDVIVHEMTAIPPSFNPRRFDQAFAMTNRLRTEGTDHVVAAGEAAGVRRFVAQSFAAWPYMRQGSWVKRRTTRWTKIRRRKCGARSKRSATSSVTLQGPFEGLALRYGGFCGPGSSLARTGPIADAVRRRRFPITGAGAGVWSFVHLDDAAEATALAVERGAPGVYNVTRRVGLRDQPDYRSRPRTGHRGRPARRARPRRGSARCAERRAAG